MRDPTFLHDTAIVLLNYMTTEEPLNMLASCKSYYPNIRVVIVDNGSPRKVVEKLENTAKKYKNVSVLALQENTGFARGHNAGIEVLREEGYQYICCSNSDIVFTKKEALEHLKSALVDMSAAIAGPKIRSAKGGYHKVYINRPSLSLIKARYLKYNYPFLYKILRFMHIIRAKTNKYDVSDLESDASIQVSGVYVYQLHGAFLMFGPLFFSEYQGFDPNTFLYGEERILAEMLRKKNMQAVFVSKSAVSHSVNKTSSLMWKTSEKKEKIRYMRESFNYWHKTYYLNEGKNNLK